jgi:hypothetical protein
VIAALVFAVMTIVLVAVYNAPGLKEIMKALFGSG